MEQSLLEQELFAKKDDKKVQDAHEAIRPTYMTNSPASIKRRTIKRSVPFISADLEPFHGKPYGTSQIREYIRKDRCWRIIVLMHPQARSPSMDSYPYTTLTMRNPKEM